MSNDVTFDFDKIIPRRGSGSIKWDRFPKLDPFWVADMDFTSPPEVLDAIRQRVDHGVLGYAQAHEGLIQALTDYMQVRHEVKIEPAEVTHLGGLVPALSMAARAFAKPGDALMTCTPIYPPFLGVHKDADIDLITVPHILTDEQWTFDWEAMEEAVTPSTRLFLLSNPQNPLGRAFSSEEIVQLAEFCENHDLILVSDEIHCDLILDENKTPHICAASLPDKFQNRIITLLAPSKTYNIAGMGYAFAVTKDPSLKRKFESVRGHTLAEINCISYYTAEAAYRHGESWRQELLAYLRKNRDTLTEFVGTRLENCTLPDIEATYLAWIDCRALGYDNPAKHLEDTAQIYLSDGAYFGAPGHIRFNFGCPHARMLEGLEKIASAL